MESVVVLEPGQSDFCLLPEDHVLEQIGLEEVRMKICFFGSGAMGSAFGGLLTESGQDVLLIDRWKDHVDALNATGLILKEKSRSRVIRVKATTDIHGVGQADLMVLLVKSYHTGETMKQARSFIGKNTLVLSLQNGLGNEEKIAEILGKDRVLGGVTHSGSVLLGPGEVSFGRDRTCIGELDGKVTERVREIVRVFNQAGLETEASDNISAMIWSKLLVNVAVSALSAITRLPHGGMEQVEALKATAFEAVDEAVRVAAACSVKLSLQDPGEVWAKAMEGLSPGHKSSMLKDVEKGARTEIDVINGAVVSFGEKFSVPTPVNRTLVSCIKGIEFQQSII